MKFSSPSFSANPYHHLNIQRYGYRQKEDTGNFTGAIKEVAASVTTIVVIVVDDQELVGDGSTHDLLHVLPLQLHRLTASLCSETLVERMT